ncbi:helix-turn-helix transcriptional regulator [Gordonia otitidis]|nr:helix-turn-helix domain-containing protein [Gordonia otitidis]
MDAETSASSTPQSLTAGEVAKTLGLRTDDVRTMVSDGLFPNAIRGRNGAVRFPADQLPTWAEVEALLRAQRDRHLQRSLVLLDRLTSELEAVRNDINEAREFPDNPLGIDLLALGGWDTRAPSTLTGQPTVTALLQEFATQRTRIVRYDDMVKAAALGGGA